MDNATPDDTATVFRLLYRSHDLITPDRRKVELGALFSSARSRNKQLGVTGALLLSHDHFVQVLEGPEVVVRTLFDHIASDPRHDQVELVETTPSADRVFARWAMAEVAEDGGDDVPLIAHTDGIAPSAGHRLSSEQASLLAAMRSVAVGAHASQA